MDTVNDDDLGLVLFGKTRAAVLGLMLGSPDEEFHVRRISRLTGATLGPAQRELKLLVRLGLLKSRVSGHQLLYRANASSPIYEELRSIVIKTIGLADVLKAALQPIASQIQLAFVFGSFARGTHRAASDVDIMVIGTASTAAVTAALADAIGQLHRELNPTLYPPREFAAKVRSGHYFLQAVMAAPRIFLIGDEDELRGLAEERLAPATPGNPPGTRRPTRRRRPRPEHQRRPKA